MSTPHEVNHRQSKSITILCHTLHHDFSDCYFSDLVPMTVLWVAETADLANYECLENQGSLHVYLTSRMKVFFANANVVFNLHFTQSKMDRISVSTKLK